MADSQCSGPVAAIGRAISGRRAGLAPVSHSLFVDEAQTRHGYRRCRFQMSQMRVAETGAVMGVVFFSSRFLNMVSGENRWTFLFSALTVASRFGAECEVSRAR